MDSNKNTAAFMEHSASYADWKRWWDASGRHKYDDVRPSVTVDCCILTYDTDRDLEPENTLKTLLVKRETHPYRNQWSIPGTFLREDEHDALTAVKRELEWLFGDDKDVPFRMQQIRTFTGAERDPRGQTASILYAVYIPDGTNIEISDAVNDGMWEPVKNYLPQNLQSNWHPVQPDDNETYSFAGAFDHAQMLTTVALRMQDQFAWTPNVFYTLPEEFTLTEAMRLRSSLFDEPMLAVGRANFRKKYSGLWDVTGVLEPSDPRSEKLFSVQNRRGMSIER